jgi:N-methylhydantoinase A/oxoprolinase/acetone carboxylase beta subunit
VGIDVGGTFTDVVAIDAASHVIVARVKVPTTHSAPEGVAAGIVVGLQRLLEHPAVPAEAIAFIAHSTTQATNALLEGDVARVGVIGLLDGFSCFARAQMRLGPLDLGGRARLVPVTRFARACDAASVSEALDALQLVGVDAVAVSDAFGVDRPRREADAVACARERGIPATAGHEVSSLYGLRARTRTAVLNAGILPTMMRTAEMTARAVEQAGISAPLMIMRSDGGVMDVREVARRPILTMLSGPAAGIAGALLHENVTDGIFIEVGGTSADLSVIRRGLPQMRPARIGKHRTMLRTLDVRTIAIAGGSMSRWDPASAGVAALRDVGPRSAHIAGLRYACFTPPDALADARVVFIRSHADDPADYLALALRDGTSATITPTCAANLLGYVGSEAFARGDAVSAGIAFSLVGAYVGCEAAEVARAILARCAQRVGATIAELVDDYELDVRSVELIGGGGGAAAIVPFLAEAEGFAYRLARDAEVISPIGVALALTRDVVERTIVNPSTEDIVRVRREAMERVVAAGAAPELVEVVMEIDARRNLVRATASGATAAAAQAFSPEVSAEERTHAVARAAHAEAEGARVVASVGSFEAYVIEGRRASDTYIVDRSGVVRVIARDAVVRATTMERSEAVLTALLDEATSFGDVGRALPDIHIAYGRRIADLGALAQPDQVMALVAEELRGLAGETLILLIASRRAA